MVKAVAADWKIAAFEARALVGLTPWEGGPIVPLLSRPGLMKAEFPKMGYDRDMPTHVEIYFAGRCVWVKPVPRCEHEKVLAGQRFSVEFPFTQEFGDST